MLAAIDIALQRAVDHAHNEVYVGTWTSSKRSQTVAAIAAERSDDSEYREHGDCHAAARREDGAAWHPSDTICAARCERSAESSWPES